MPIILEKLNFCYPQGTGSSEPAVKDISLTIPEGEFLGVIGHTGSGKSTMIQHFNALLLPTSGSVTVDGMDTREKKNRPAIRSNVGMVFQYPEYQLFDESVLQDVGFGPRNMGLPESEVRSRSEAALERVGLDPKRFGEKSPFDLSGGQKRRAALAGILAMQPKYLVLDEPMAGLDPLGRKEILDLLQSLKSDLGTTIIMVSHSMDDVAQYADRIAVLSHGELLLLGSPSEVFSKADLLYSIGLDIPIVSKIRNSLVQKGFDLPAGLYRYEDLLEELAGRWKNVRV